MIESFIDRQVRKDKHNKIISYGVIGRIVAEDSPKDIIVCKESITGQYLKHCYK